MLDKIKPQFNRCNKFNNQDSNPTGFLSVTVLNKLNNKPVSFAEISVYHKNISGIYGESGTANLVSTSVTNEDGEVPLIELPVISDQDLSVIPNTSYFITVRHFRYNPLNLMNIQIHPNITTTFNVLLTPITSATPRFYDYHITPEIITKSYMNPRMKG